MKHLDIYLALTGATVASLAPVPGEMTALNSSTNYAGSLSQEVTGFVSGLPSTDEEKLLDLLFPPIETNDMFQFCKADDEAFLTESDDSDIRNVGGSFKRIQFRGTTVTLATQQKGLTLRVDHKQLPKKDGKIVSGWENQRAAMIKSRLVRADIIRGLALLDAAAVNANEVWDATTNPDGDLRAMIELTRTATGRRATHTLLGATAQQLRQDAYEAPTRANHAMANHANYSMEELARYLNTGKVVIEDGVKQTKKGSTKIDRLGLAAYSYSAEQGALLDDPSNIKRAWNNTPFGGKWAVSIKPDTYYTDITVFQESLLFVPQTTGIRKTTVSAT